MKNLVFQVLTKEKIGHIVHKLLRGLISLFGFIVFVSFWCIIVHLIYGGIEYTLNAGLDIHFSSNTLSKPILLFFIFLAMWIILNRINHNEFSFENIFINPIYYLVLSFIIYNAFVLAVVLHKYYSFSIGQAHDFAFRHHAIYNTLMGNTLRTDIFPWLTFKNWNFLGDHFSPFIFFYVPWYYFFKQGDCLLVAQSFIISLAAVPIFLIAKEKLKNDWLSLIISVSYLMYPIVIQLYFHEMRIEFNALPLLLFAFYYIQKRKLFLTVMFLILAGLCKEEVFIAVAMIGAYMFLCTRGFKYRLTGLLIAIIGVLVFILLMEYILPTISGSTHCRYNQIGGKNKIINILLCNKTVIQNEILKPDFLRRKAFFINYFKSLGFLPLLSPVIFLAGPFLLQNWLSDIIATIDFTWHSALIVPFLFISLIYGVRNILRISKKCSVAVFIWLLSFNIAFGGYYFKTKIINPFFAEKLYNQQTTDEYIKFKQAQKQLPEGASFFTQFALLPNLSNRDNLQWVQTCHRNIEEINTDYLIFSPYKNVFLNEGEIFSELIESNLYKTIYANDTFIVMLKQELVQEYEVEQFRTVEEFKSWSIEKANTEYEIEIENDHLQINTYFDGGKDEDEFLQMRKNVDISVMEYPLMLVEYEVDDRNVQFVEIVLGIDFNDDKIADVYIRGIVLDNYLQPYSSTAGLKKALVWIPNVLKKQFPAHGECRIIELEIYPHKRYGVDMHNLKDKKYGFAFRQIVFVGRVKN